MLTAGGSRHRPLRLHRWADRLFQYTFSVVYRPGKQNVVADCLSRAFESTVSLSVVPSGQISDDVEDDDDIAIQTIFGNLATSVVTLEMVAAATSADPDLQRVLQHVLHGWPSSKPEVASELRPFFDVQAELSVTGSGRCLLRGSRVIIPTSLRQQLLELAHEGHPGISRMKSKCRAAIWWPGLDSELERFVRDCTACVVSGKSTKPTPGPLQPVQFPAGPWRKLSVDIAGEFVAAPSSHRYMIVTIDYFSKWPEVATCSCVTSGAVIEFLNRLFDRFGLVEEIVIDNGTQFTSVEFETYLKAFCIRHGLATGGTVLPTGKRRNRTF